MGSGAKVGEVRGEEEFGGYGDDEDRSESKTSMGGVAQVIVMVGLPARGKTYIAKKLARYLNWVGVRTRVFSASYTTSATVSSHDFFDPSHLEGKAIRLRCQDTALEDALAWLGTKAGDVAVFDATNSTVERRGVVRARVLARGARCLFLESVCDSDLIVDSLVREVGEHNPDYSQVSEGEAMEDFRERIRHYEEIYEPMAEAREGSSSFIKVFNTGENYLIHKIEGSLQSKIVYWVMNVHIVPRTIYLTRHGESEYNQLGKIGGDSELSPRGQQYARALAQYFHTESVAGLRVWTSRLRRTIQTSAHINAPQERWRALNQIDAGWMENLTYEQMAEKFPEEFAARQQDKLSYRYPSGESYEDIVARLEPVMMELERQGNVLLVAHQAVLRCIMAYFLDRSDLGTEDLPYIEVPLHTLIKLTPQAYGCEAEFIKFPIEGRDTQWPAPWTPSNLGSCNFWILILFVCSFDVFNIILKIIIIINKKNAWGRRSQALSCTDSPKTYPEPQNLSFYIYNPLLTKTNLTL